jgi:hypothetical protein
MKNFIAILGFSLLSLAAQAQTPNDKYIGAMEKALSGMDTIQTAEQWLDFANKFERIASKEPKEWLPAYYVALGQDMAFNMTTDKSKYELLANRAEEFINKADALQPDNAEIYLLKSMVAGLFIRLNPMVNGPKYAPVSQAYMDKSMALDPENPRTYMQQGITLFYTPEQWGGSKTKGKEMLEIAKSKFEVFKPASSIHPNWGKKMNDYFLEMVGK